MIPCSKPNIIALERGFVNDALEQGDIGPGPYVEKFENAWSSYNRMQYGVSCNSGTNAIYLALKALGVGPGDEVILPEYTMIATAWAVTYCGATPVFVDCKDDLLMDVSKIKPTEKTKAIITVAIYGRRPQFPHAGIPVIEDLAEGHGIRPQGAIACYSFYGNKIITTGEGGMCLTNNEHFAEEMRLYANMYFDKERKYLHPKVGHNFRMTNLQAAIGYGQTIRIEELLHVRKQVEQWYDQYLPEDMRMPEREVVWMYDIDCGDRQEEVKENLRRHHIESRYGFKPMSMQPMYLGQYEHLNAYKWSKRILYLPTYPELQESDIKKICLTLSLEKK